jgi:hypothetical protein
MTLKLTTVLTMEIYFLTVAEVIMPGAADFFFCSKSVHSEYTPKGYTVNRHIY